MLSKRPPARLACHANPQLRYYHTPAHHAHAAASATGVLRGLRLLGLGPAPPSHGPSPLFRFPMPRQKPRDQVLIKPSRLEEGGQHALDRLLPEHTARHPNEADFDTEDAPRALPS